MGGVAKAVNNPEEAIGYLVDVLRRHRTKRVITSNFPLSDELGLKRVLKQASVEVVDEEADDVHEAEIGLTGVLVAIADSGTLLLDREAGGCGIASILPPVHMAFLRESQMRLNLAEAFIDLKLALAQGHKEFVLITGPSRTADIEQTLILGVHGPKEIHAVILP